MTVTAMKVGCFSRSGSNYVISSSLLERKKLAVTQEVHKKKSQYPSNINNSCLYLFFLLWSHNVKIVNIAFVIFVVHHLARELYNNDLKQEWLDTSIQKFEKVRSSFNVVVHSEILSRKPNNLDF